jgi:5-methylcytosine-specific restriction endonuclease McrA
MRPLTKLAEPAILTENAAEWSAEYVAGAAKGKPPRGRWGHPEIRDRLKDEVLCKCAYCEAYVEDVSYYEVEHIIPKIRGGSDHPSNLALACRRCNRWKHDRIVSILVEDRIPYFMN